MEPETVIPTSSDDRVKKLEEALETAAKERQEILEAAEKEIDYHRSIAAELESSMINDFEWKLHEIESEYNRYVLEYCVGLNMNIDLSFLTLPSFSSIKFK